MTFRFQLRNVFFALPAALLAACGAPEREDAAFPGCEGAAPQAVYDLCVISSDAMEGRLVGTPGNARARAYIESRFAEIGLEPVGEDYAQPFEFQRRVDFRDPDSARETIAGVNLIGRIAGAQPGPVMAVTAHYDHLGMTEEGGIYNGADDNASGTAAILALAEYFMANRSRHDMLVIAFDAEEGGLNGARHFVANRPEGAGEIAFNLNLDMVGFNTGGGLWAAGSYHTPELLPLVEAAAQDAPILLQAGYDRPTGDPRDDWTLLSDHGPFHVAGVPFLYLGVEDHEHYHQTSDEFSTIDQDFFLGAVETAIDVARRADAALADIGAARRARKGG